MDKVININELNQYIKSNLPKQTFTVSGEVSKPSFRNHIYLTLKDKDASINSIIWKYKYENFNIQLKDGDKITVKGKIDYYEKNGSVSFIINELVKFDGEGELKKLYDKYLKDFQKKGYFNDTNKYEIPNIIKKILIVTSEKGAALQDFLYALDNNNSKVKYDILDVAVQGNNCPSDLINKLDKLENIYDLVVITRGGGSFEDLFGFSKPEIVEFIYTFEQPVLSAIGHQVDISLLDYIADVNVPTPTLAAQYIIDINKEYINNCRDIEKEMKNDLIDLNYNLLTKLNKLNDRINKEMNILNELENDMKYDLLDNLNNYLLKLKECQMKLDNMTSRKDIVIKYNDEEINLLTFKNIYENNKKYSIWWNNIEFKINQ